MDYNFELSEKPAQHTLSIRTRTRLADLPQVIGEAYGAIIEYLNEIKEAPAGAPFTAYYNLDMEDLDVEMGFPWLNSWPARIVSSPVPFQPVNSWLICIKVLTRGWPRFMRPWRSGCRKMAIPLWVLLTNSISTRRGKLRNPNC